MPYVTYTSNDGEKMLITQLSLKASQEKLVDVLKRIVDTGESILVGYNKLYITTNKKDTFQ